MTSFLFQQQKQKVQRTVACIHLEKLADHGQLTVPARLAHVLKAPSAVVPHVVGLWVQLQIVLNKLELAIVYLVGGLLIAICDGNRHQVLLIQCGMHYGWWWKVSLTEEEI